MPLSQEQRQQVVEAITSGRLRLDRPQKIYAGYGDGTECSACGAVIDKRQVEWEATYDNGQAYRLHLACAGLWEAERLRRTSTREEAEQTLRQSTNVLAQAASKQSAQLSDRADELARESEAVIEEAREVKRGEQPPA